MTENITMYTKRSCPYCESAKRFFASHEIPFTVKDLSDSSEELAALVSKTGHRTVPQIFLGDRFIGGYAELIALHDNGGLADWLRKK